MHTKTEATTTTTYKPSLMQRMRGAKTTRATRPADTGVTGTRNTRTTRGTAAATTTRPARTTNRRGHGTTTTATPVRRQQRKTSIGDKISGGLMKLKGDPTGRRGQKAAGTRRMNGTDGKVKKRGLF